MLQVLSSAISYNDCKWNDTFVYLCQRWYNLFIWFTCSHVTSQLLPQKKYLFIEVGVEKREKNYLVNYTCNSLLLKGSTKDLKLINIISVFCIILSLIMCAYHQHFQS